ncbi:MAG: hypothetical protein PHG81_12615 [Aliarcobacter sp.]|nr:hypothetical protein [Aliarcobacter sp.]
MGIKLFTFILLILSVGSYFIPVENLKKNLVDKDIPLVIFEDAFMYTIDENSINRIVFATHAIKYKNRDEMYNADIILKNIDATKNFYSEKLKADLIVKKGDNYTLTNNVKYTRDDFIKLNTNELFYDDMNKIAQNTKPFDAIYNNHFVKGNTVYLDVNNDFIKAKNTHFEIDVTKKN